MKAFFKVMDADQVLAYRSEFPVADTEVIPILETPGRILAEAIVSDINLPDFRRTTMDGFAVKAASTFGASEGSPGFMTVRGRISMGNTPDFALGPGEAARISTGGMLPEGADAVVMIEHTEALDESAIEVYKSVAPGQHVVEIGEDFTQGDTILKPGVEVRPQETGLLAAFGREHVTVYKRPVVGIISTGDEVVPIDQHPQTGQIRDVNTYTLASQVRESGGEPLVFGIIKDDYEALLDACTRAVDRSDMVLISGGSSVGARDFTIEALSALPDSRIRVHGISISPGKPTILAQVGTKAIWGLPGHVVSAMIVFTMITRPFLYHMAGREPEGRRIYRIPARLGRNLASVQGRVDYVRVRLKEDETGGLIAEPILGKSGLIHTMVKADGLIEIDRDTEGLDKDEPVSVIPL